VAQSVEFNIKILEERENKLLGRKELKIMVFHDLKGTPTRQDLRKLLAEMYKVPLERIYIWRIKTLYGIGRSVVEAGIYESEERAKAIEPKYVLERHSPKKEEEGGEG